MWNNDKRKSRYWDSEIVQVLIAQQDHSKIESNIWKKENSANEEHNSEVLIIYSRFAQDVAIFLDFLL